MTPAERAARIAEVRQWLADRDANANPTKLGGGWTELHLRAMLEEINATQIERHPWYGPCDALGPDGSCAECAKERR